MGKKIRIIIANATMRNGNRGCVALSISSMFMLDEILSNANVSYTFYLPRSGHTEYKEYEINVGGRILKYNAIPDISCFSLKSAIKNLVWFKRYLYTSSIYRRADCIFDIGQGDSFADIYGKRRFDWIFAQYKLGKKYHLPYCILPQTIGPFKDNRIKKRALKGINWASCVLVRDKLSFDFVKEQLPTCDVTEIIDVAFFMPYTKKNFDSSFVHVGLNVSALLWHGGYTRDNQFGLSVDYQKIVRNIIGYFLSVDNVKLHLVPHVVAGERSVENDYAVSYDLLEEFHHPNLILSPLFLDPITAKSYIAGMDFFMGARMHATIAAFSSGVPVVPMAYSRKFNGLFIDSLQYPNVVDMKKQLDESILSTIQSAYSQRIVLKNMIAERMSTIVDKRGRLLEEKLKEFIGLN